MYFHWIFHFIKKGLTLNVNTLISLEIPETVKEDEFYLKEEEEKEIPPVKIPENINEKNPHEIDRLFQEELKRMIDV